MSLKKLTNKYIIIAMDFSNYNEAISFAKKLDPNLCRLKVGLELFVSAGPIIIKDLKSLGFEIFLDLKFHDIPNTVEGAILSAIKLDVWMISIHCLGGKKMMQQAMSCIKSITEKKPIIVGVTILTSMNDEDIFDIGIKENSAKQVIDLAKLAEESGLDGIVCSGQEAESIRKIVKNSFILVTPGIRIDKVNQDDQERITTPKKAIQSGVDYLVVGRPITKSENPMETLKEFYYNI